MEKNNPKNTISRCKVVLEKINSICIDFSGYQIQQVGGNNRNNLPSRNDSEQFTKYGEGSAGQKANENSAEHFSGKKEKERKNLASFSLRKYVAEKTRKQYEECGKLLPLQPNSNVVAANRSPIKNATITIGVVDENKLMEENTLEVSIRALSLNKALGGVIKEENNVGIDAPNDDSAAKKGWVVQKRQIHRRKQKTRLLSELYQITKSIGETNGVSGLVANDLLPVAPSGRSPSSHGPVIKEEILSEPQDPSNDMPTLQRTTTFQVVNVVGDLDFEEECSDICIRRRRKHA